MNKILLLVSFAIAMAAFTVNCAEAKVPTSTNTAIEKAMATTVSPATSEGTNITIIPMLKDANGAWQVIDLRLAEIHWVADETFYSTGYKAFLNKEVTEMFVPPNSKRNLPPA